jgi:phosphopantetheine adenylyltransferase
MMTKEKIQKKEEKKGMKELRIRIGKHLQNEKEDGKEKNNKGIVKKIRIKMKGI